MKRVLIGLIAGLALSVAAHGEETETGTLMLSENTVQNIRGDQFKIPQSYGRLVSVVNNSEIHYLYFEDVQGQIRVVMIGQRGATQRSRNPLQLLTPDVHLIERDPNS